jgi:hypothetical protein
MYASRIFYVSILTLALVLAGHVRAAHAANVPSDRMVINDSTGTAIFDNSIPEDPAGETTLTWAGGPTPVNPPPIPLTSVLTIPGVSVLILSEPANQPPDPTEPPPLTLQIPGGPTVLVSDVVISTLAVPAAAPPFVSLVSDGDPELQAIVPILQTLQGVQVLEETGQLQDLTQFLGGPAGTNQVQILVQSDVPEPSTLLLAAGALALLSLPRRRGVS